ncbi:MAG: tRNA preQ1(34) S-adenosylmethionine ribosyltransferase-isomerase QueA [candidate division Zixibacteria bacterium]|nr:tRNA preQ1(34) S-adenosylmethionine ribosyltransferase-isomerase QueA [candidate division Zixibacteria bacterium]MDH3938243.1 tRNA preQ1(34) S-adenosylmethionine ribosyltransferase-isomerase QueA [candidate division Zixibacteria bacterium]MDH4034388.1 tRNA preQ1(34) S-adenosylmethionine ribosyltransferase-isomerase QueA [candidate division Zixibacteria bacterium]
MIKQPSDISLYDYNLPPELIAQTPSRRRDQSRLMVLDRQTSGTCVKSFKSIADYLNPGDALVVNSTKVFKARLFGRRPTGAKVELFLVRTVEPDRPLEWIALVSPSRRVREGEMIQFGPTQVRLDADIGGGRWLVSFAGERQRDRIIHKFGHVPLPHYIKRDDQPSDLRRYQTVFADSYNTGAVAAPTAGFHFTRSLLDVLKSKGVSLIDVCLHVGPGTFKPVKVDNIDEHVVDPEMATLSPQAASSINKVRKRGGKIVAVGTTSVRTLESAQTLRGQIQPFSGMVDLYIKPGHRFNTIDHLITNFHLPKSSLLILVSAFAGRERIMAAYDEAIQQRMRFFSYGDAMLIR